MLAVAKSRAEMVEAWQRVAPPVSSPSSQPLPRALNLGTVLDLGNRVYFTFRGRAFGIPPLAWREGEKILDAWMEARGFGDLEPANLSAYFSVMERLQKLLWRNCVPTGPVRRFLHWLGLHRNPFRKATEGEVAELALFMLGRRMNAGVPIQVQEELRTPSRET